MKINLVKDPACSKCDQDGITPNGNLCECLVATTNYFDWLFHEADIVLPNITWPFIKQHIGKLGLGLVFSLWLENPRQRRALEVHEDALMLWPRCDGKYGRPPFDKER